MTTKAKEKKILEGGERIFFQTEKKKMFEIFFSAAK